MNDKLVIKLAALRAASAQFAPLSPLQWSESSLINRADSIRKIADELEDWLSDKA